MANPQPTEIPIGNGFYVSESLPISSQICQNFYPNYPETDSTSTAQLLPSPGLVEIKSSGDIESNRGSHVMNSKPYFVNESILFRLNRIIDIDGNEIFDLEDLSTPAGEPITGTTRVSMADNGTQLIIVEPGTGNGWVYTEAGGLVKITDTDFTVRNAEIVVFIDGFFVLSTASKVFFHSNLNNGLSYGALDFGTAEADPDIIRSLHVHRNQLYVFGSETIEVFQNIGGSGFVFQRIRGFVIPKGIASPFSVTEYNGTFVFIGQGVNESPKIYAFTGNDVTPISTTAIDFALQKSSDTEIEEAFVWNYSFRGATFAGWSLTNGTFVYESKSSGLSQKPIWHTRKSQNLQEKSRWRINSLVTAYGRLLVGDSESGIIGEIDNDEATDYGNPIIRDVSFLTLENNSQMIFFSRFEAVLESGLGLEDNSIPQIRMSYSDDAKNYKPERSRSAGKVGEYDRKAAWNQLGSTRRFRIFRLTMSDPIRWVINKCLVTMDG